MNHKIWARRFAAFTLIELLVVVAIIGVLIAVLLPALGTARHMGKLIACSANLRNMGLAEAMYVEDNRGFVPPGDAGGTWWDDRLRGDTGPSRYIKGRAIFRCPADTTPACVKRNPSVYPKRSYAVNQWFHGNVNWPPYLYPRRMADIEWPSTTLSIVDTWAQDNTSYYGWYATVSIPRHFDEDGHQNKTRTNELYFDGRVQTVRDDEYLPLPGAMNVADPLWWRHYLGR